MIRNIWTRNRARLLSSNWKSKQQETRETHEIIILIILSRFDNDFSPLSVPISNEFRGGARGRDRRLERRLRAECPWIGNGKREGERRYRYHIGKNALIYAGIGCIRRDIRRDTPRPLCLSPSWLDLDPSTLPTSPQHNRDRPIFPRRNASTVPRRYFSFLARDLGCPNSPSVSSRASTIPFPSPVAWRGAERAGRGNFSRRTKGTNRRCSNDKQSP